MQTLGTAVGGLMLGLLASGLGPAARPPAALIEPGPGSLVQPASALAVLDGWEDRRASAYAADDVTALRDLYLPGSTAAAQDVRMLRTYERHRTRVVGLGMQVLRARTLVFRRTEVRVVVVDRVARGYLEGPAQCFRLPVDPPRQRTVTLRLTGGMWRLASST